MAAGTEAAIPLPPRQSGLVRFARGLALLRESPVGMVGAGIVLAWALAAIFAPLLAPFDPNATILPFQRPGAIDPATGHTFWLGTDKIGRDIRFFESALDKASRRISASIVLRPSMRSNSRTRSSSFFTSELPTTGSSESTAAAPPSLKSLRHR